MTSLPVGPKPRPSLPLHLTNGTSSLHTNCTATSVGKKERQKLAAAIESSHHERQPLDLDAADQRHSKPNEALSHKLNGDIHKPTALSPLNQAARDPRDEAESPLVTATASPRPASPYTLNPPIDFDGLSWPSKSRKDFSDLDLD